MRSIVNEVEQCLVLPQVYNCYAGCQEKTIDLLRVNKPANQWVKYAQYKDKNIYNSKSYLALAWQADACILQP
jgi:hypothetical protein